MTVLRSSSSWFRGINSKPGLLLAVAAIVIPFVPLLSHRLDALALISMPLALIAARMERDARVQHG